MQTSDKSATAFDKVATLSAERERLHAMRFAYVKLHRAVLDVERQLLDMQRKTEERERWLASVREDAMFQRSLCWKEIEAIDSQVSTLMAQLNNGVYDEVSK